MRGAISILVSLLLVLSCALHASAELPLETFGNRPDVIDAELSPDGSTISYLRRIDGEEYFQVLTLEGEELIKLQTDGSKSRNIKYLSANSASFVIGRTIKEGYRTNFEAAYRLSINIAEQKGSVLLRNERGLGQSNLQTVVASTADYAYMPAWHKVGAVSAIFNLYEVPVRGGANVRLATGDSDTVQWFFHPKSGQILREDRNSRNTEQVLYSVTNDESKRIYGPAEPINLIGFGENGESLLALDTYDGDDYPTLTIMTLGDDDAVSLPFNHEIDRVIRSADGTVKGFQLAGLTPEFSFFHTGLDQAVKAFQARYPKASVWYDSSTDDHALILFRIEGPNEPGRFALYNTEKQSEKTLINIRNAMTPENMGQIEAFNYTARDGVQIEAILTSPLTPSSQTPLIILPHGGPAAYDQIGFDWLAQYLANKGYRVLQPNFRGSDGYGRAFEELGNGEWGKAMQEDLEDGLNALIAANKTNGNSVCIIGASYGGYAALAGAVFQPELYQCIISIAGVSDLHHMMKTERRRLGRNHWVVAYWERIIADGERRRSAMNAVSPVKFAYRVNAPILLVHGEDDTVVPLDQSRRMAKALRRAKKDYELIKIKGGDHWLLDSKARLATLKAIDAFLDENLPVSE